MRHSHHFTELGMVAGLAGVLVWLFWPEPVAVDVIELSRGPITTLIRGEGRARVKDLYVIAAPLKGWLHRITLKPGEAVVTGEAVAQLTPALPTLLDARSQAVLGASAQAAQANAEAALGFVTAAQAGETYAATELARARALISGGFISLAAQDLATTTLAARQANLSAATFFVQAARHRTEGVRVLLSQPDPTLPPQTVVAITAPASGRVLQVIQDSETMVWPGQPLLTLGDLARMEVVVPLPSEQAVGLYPGLTARLERWGGPALPGRISRIEPAGHTVLSLLGFEEQRVAVIIDILAPPDAHVGLGDGYRLDITIERETHDGMQIPVGALVRRDDSWTVYTVENGHARQRPILELRPGTRVVVYPGERVTDGVRVRLR